MTRPRTTQREINMYYMECKVGDQIEIVLDDVVLIEISQIRYVPGDVKFLLEAPRDIKIYRQEVLDRMSERSRQ